MVILKGNKRAKGTIGVKPIKHRISRNKNGYCLVTFSNYKVYDLKLTSKNKHSRKKNSSNRYGLIELLERGC